MQWDAWHTIERNSVHLKGFCPEVESVERWRCVRACVCVYVCACVSVYVFISDVCQSDMFNHNQNTMTDTNNYNLATGLDRSKIISTNPDVTYINLQFEIGKSFDDCYILAAPTIN